MRNPNTGGGLFASTSRLLATLLEIAQVRLELLGTEVELEKRRLFDGLFWGALALMVLGASLTLACGFVILLFWEGYRLAAVGVLTLLLTTVGILLLQDARKRLQSHSGLFSHSATEIKQDQTRLRTQDQHAAPR